MIPFLNLLAQLRPWHLVVTGVAGVIIFGIIGFAGVVWTWRAREAAKQVTTISATIAPGQTSSSTDTKISK